MPLVFLTLSSRFRGYTRRLHLTVKSPPDPLPTPSRPPPDPRVLYNTLCNTLRNTLCLRQ
eukprot:213176-Prorocentrum_minimum.AAC.1